MPKAIFEFAYKPAQLGDASEAATQRIQKALSGVSKQAIQQEISKHEGYEVTVADMRPLKDGTGVEVTIGIDEPPRRADTVKTIIDELERVGRRIGVIFDFEISSEFADADWQTRYQVKQLSELKATKGFKLGSTRKRSWWFPIGFVLGCAVTYYALNFATVNQQVGTMIEQMRQKQ